MYLRVNLFFLFFKMACPTTTWHLFVFVLWHTKFYQGHHKSMGMEFAVGVWVTTLWLHHWRQLFPFFLAAINSQTVNSSWGGRSRASQPLLLSWVDAVTSSLMPDSLQAMAAAVNSWLLHPCQAIMVRLYNTCLYHPALTFFLPILLQCSLSFRGWETYIPFQTGYSIVI